MPSFSNQTNDTPNNVDQVPVLLQTKRDTCTMLGIGLTKCDDLIARGILGKVPIGRHVRITTESIYKAARVK
jgi:hypothetical protein